MAILDSGGAETPRPEATTTPSRRRERHKTVAASAAFALAAGSLVAAAHLLGADSEAAVAGSLTISWSPGVRCATTATEADGYPARPALQDIAIPANTVSVIIEATGGSGGSAYGINGGGGQAGGAGGSVRATFPVSATGDLRPGGTLSAIQGCSGPQAPGGTNLGVIDKYYQGGTGWSAGGRATVGGAPGGGSSAVLTSTGTLLVVAGGGGGGGGGTCALKYGWEGGAGGAGSTTRAADGTGYGPSGSDGDAASGTGPDKTGRGGTTDGSAGSGAGDGGHGARGLTTGYGGYAGGGGGYVGGVGGVDYGFGCQSMGGGGGGSSYVRDGATDVVFATDSTPGLTIWFEIGDPALSLTTVLSGSTDNDRSGTHTLGDDLEFTSTATNTGDLTLDTVVVTDRLTGRSTTCTAVAPGKTCVLTVIYRVAQKDVDTGAVTADVEATSPQVTEPATDTETVTVVVRPVVDPKPEGPEVVPNPVPSPGPGTSAEGTSGSRPASGPSRDELARTGAEVKNWWFLGATLIPLGAALLLIRRYGARSNRPVAERD